MEKIKFSIFIEAPVEKVWNTMLDDETYRKWTTPFHPGSYYKGGWNKGDRIQFLSPEGDGMFSRIADNRQYEFISIEHLGIIKNGAEDTDSEEAKKWAPAHENYIFAKKGEGTELTVEVETNQEYKDMFEDMWPKSLQILKELSEK